MKQVFLTQEGPKAVGPYSTATVFGGVAYLSGMIPLDPLSGELVGADIEAQSRQVFGNIATVLREMRLTMGDVLKVTVFLTDMENFARMNAVYAEYFGPNYPSRSCVAVSALPKGALVEAEVIVAAE